MYLNFDNGQKKFFLPTNKKRVQSSKINFKIKNSLRQLRSFKTDERYIEKVFNL